MARILFHGGPCDGQHVAYDDTVAGTGTVECGGMRYNVTAVAEGEYLATLPGVVVNPAAGLPEEAPEPADALAAWGRLNHALAYKLPHRLDQVTAAGARIRSGR